VSPALIASEYAHGPTILLVLAGCVLLSALVGRWWTLAVPVVVAAAVFALSLDNDLYARVPEDIQAAVVFGATYGLALGAVALLVRRGIERWLDRRPAERARPVPPRGTSGPA
jgi:hypothetical protein